MADVNCLLLRRSRMKMTFICYNLLPRYIMRNEGIDTEAGYPSPCNKSCCFLKDKVGATVTGKS